MHLPVSPAPAPRHTLQCLRFDSLLFLLAALGAWALPVSAAASPALDRFQELRQQDLRVAEVAYRLSVANEGLCRNALSPQFGFTLHSIEQYGPGDRKEAAHSFGLGLDSSVMAVVEGSPADKAGLAAEDRLVSVNGRDLTTAVAAGNGPATRAFVERVQQIISEEMRKGAVTLRVSGARGRRDLEFAAEAGCSTNVELVPGDEVNAWADGERVVVSTALLRHCRTDDDLALVIAHELAHNILHHGNKRAVVDSPEGKRLGLFGSALAEMRQTEEEADRLGVRMANAANYDLGQAESFLSRLMKENDPVAVAATHPAADRRLTLLRTEIAAVSGTR